MQRLVLAVLILALLAGLVVVLALGLRAAARSGGAAFESGEFGNTTLQKLAYAALFVLIVGVSVGLLGGL
ncbi:hypothetical protein [Roseitranquillus sediminis]|uniref:hypothetical protein n=1 Tax=Roseitranquillus sediminis TaxID=2809051 RepID=UPI001D0C4540|nr:hypothetical protein [Roseitranquillus sediminis]MBM9594795.1 hypothetical protein [Roseitranquillus sediminis]